MQSNRSVSASPPQRESAQEIGAIERFGSKASLALYLGMAGLDHGSGTHTGTKRPRQVNTRAKEATLIAAARHKAPWYSMRSGRAMGEAW